ncbi:MAG: M3 family metallopeptidase [Deltaproteobacteria bacterium]|nr:M3 family metallopeptidase [Deltaproteobacteria bacterium]
MSDVNPLLRLGDRLPAFDRITPAHVEPAICGLCERVSTGFEGLERDLEAAGSPSWEGTLTRLHDLVEPLRLAWGVVNHLMAVRNSPELRAAHQAVQPEVVRLFVRVGQSRPLYEALGRLRAEEAWAALDATQRRVVENERRDMELSGVGLEGAARERFQAVSLELSELSTRFSNQLLDATKAFELLLTHSDEVAGLPASARAVAAAGARAHGHAGATPEAGPWRISLDAPSFGPFLEHARRRDLREALYRAFVARASSEPQDNRPLLERILALRQELAKLLGRRTYAEVSLAAKMAGHVAAADALLDRLRAAARPRAEEEHRELTAFAREKSGDASLALALWDVPFWAERLREVRYAYTDEELRPYFALPRVLDGLFALAERLFGVRITAADGEAPVWHADVRYFRLAEAESSAELASFYLDPYSRPADKRGGAWMDTCLDRLVTEWGVRRPVAYLVCNQTPPVGGTPSLMTFREVETLFHEFGHGLQHLLTTVDHPQAAGINGVEWDAVELASQFLENWCYDPATVLGTPDSPGLARHWQTGEPLPPEVFDRVRGSRTCRAATATLRQVYLATLDLELHHRRAPGEASRAVQERVAARNTVLPPLPEDRFLCSFAHLFAGGYAAGYYSYKWAEVLAADAFAGFEEAGLADPEAVARTGRRFRATVLSLGGSRPPLEVFRAFRGRDPSPEPLLRQAGLA